MFTPNNASFIHTQRLLTHVRRKKLHTHSLNQTLRHRTSQNLHPPVCQSVMCRENSVFPSNSQQIHFAFRLLSCYEYEN